jgi:hypothetical protein
VILWYGLGLMTGLTVGVVAVVYVLSLTEPEETEERQALREVDRIIHVEFRVKR